MKTLKHKVPKRGEIYRRKLRDRYHHLILFRDKNNSVVMVFNSDGTFDIVSLDPDPYGIDFWELT